MTLEELLKIIKEKRINAALDVITVGKENSKDKTIRLAELKGAIDTYTDLICLIESKIGKEED